MMTIDEQIQIFETEYLPKIYGFAHLKTNSKEEAEDLAQEIALQVIATINAGKSIENMNAFVWSVSNHTFYNTLRNKKRSTAVYLTELLPSDDDVEKEYILKEQKALLHRELALMSGAYWKAVVMHYFEGLSCEKIGKELNTSSGTVKWWLYDARRVIKEGMNTMKEYGEKSYKPGTLRLSCQCMPGAGNEPMRCAERKSAQNILLAAYQNPVTVEELCTELGISAPYIEDEVKYLTDNQLMKEVSAGKYQTDFVILPGQNVMTADKIYNACFPEYYNELVKYIDAQKELLSSEVFNTAHFSWDRLLWVYLHIINDIMLCKFKREECKIVMYQDVPDRPNGGKWIALGYESNYFSDTKPEWKQYQPWDGPVHKTDNAFAQGFLHYWSGLDSSIFFDLPNAVFALCREIIKGEKSVETLTEDEKYLFSIAVEKGLFIKDGKKFSQNYYFVKNEERKRLEKYALDFYDTAFPYFKKAYGIVLKEYLPGVPKHLHWQMGNFLSCHLNAFVTCSLYEALRVGDLSAPDENNKAWLSLFASE